MKKLSTKMMRLLVMLIALLGVFGTYTAQDTLPLPSDFDETAGVYNGFSLIAPATVVETTQFVAFDLRRQLNVEGQYFIKFKNVTTGVVNTFVLPENALTFYNDMTIGFNLETPYIFSFLGNNTSYKVWVMLKDTTNQTKYLTPKSTITTYKAMPVTLTSPAKNSTVNAALFYWNAETPATAKYYRTNIYDGVTGQLVFSKTGFCCSMAAYANTLTSGKTYTWQVITYGYEGVTAKSKRYPFTYLK